MLEQFIYPRQIQEGDYNGETRSLKKSIFSQKGNAIIAEIKHASPSNGFLNARPVHELAREMESSGAAAISVLTEPKFFQGRLENITLAKNACNIPIMCKDFITSKAQIDEAGSFGADAVLLITELLGDKTAEFVEHAHAIGLETIAEAHTEEAMEFALSSRTDFIGINNRNLDTLEIDLGTTRRLSPKAKGRPVVSESGIRSPEDVRLLKGHADAFLVGTHLMKSKDIGEALRGFACA